MARERLRPMLLLSQDMATMVDMAMDTVLVQDMDTMDMDMVVMAMDMAMVVMVMDMAMARDPLRPSQDMVTMDTDMAMDMDMDTAMDLVTDTTDKQYKCFLLAV